MVSQLTGYSISCKLKRYHTDFVGRCKSRIDPTRTKQDPLAEPIHVWTARREGSESRNGELKISPSQQWGLELLLFSSYCFFFSHSQPSLFTFLLFFLAFITFHSHLRSYTPPPSQASADTFSSYHQEAPPSQNYFPGNLSAKAKHLSVSFHQQVTPTRF